jgi:hypothetical protein
MSAVDGTRGQIVAPAHGPTWHSDSDRFHHTNADCVHAEGVEQGARRRGTGGKPICGLCDRLDRIELELAGPWFPLTF